MKHQSHLIDFQKRNFICDEFFPIQAQAPQNPLLDKDEMHTGSFSKNNLICKKAEYWW